MGTRQSKAKANTGKPFSNVGQTQIWHDWTISET